MIEQDKLPEYIDRYNNKELKGKELREFLELIKQNPELRREVKLDKDLNDALADTEIIALREKVLKCKMPKETNYMRLPIFFLAASITILISLAIFVFLWLRQDDNAIMTTEFPYFYPSDSAIFSHREITDDEEIALDIALYDSMASRQKKEENTNDPKMLLTDNYKPFPPYESLVGEVSRATSFKLINPPGSCAFKKGSVIAFSWEAHSIISVTIIITDNKGQSLFTSQPINGKKYFYETSKISGGLYYVKFISNDEIVYFGKFTVQ